MGKHSEGREPLREFVSSVDCAVHAIEWIGVLSEPYDYPAPPSLISKTMVIV